MDDIQHDNMLQMHQQNSEMVAGHVPPTPSSPGPAPKFVIRSDWICKLGEKVKNWKNRFFVLLDDGTFTYYKQGPPANNAKVDFYKIGTALGSIDIKKCCLEVMDYGACNEYFASREAKLKARKKVFQSIKWPPGASQETAFGLRCADRVWFMYIPSGKSQPYIDIMRGFITHIDSAQMQVCAYTR